MPCSWALNTHVDTGNTRRATRRETFGLSHSDTERCLTGLELSPHPTLGGPPQGPALWGSPPASLLILSSASQAGHCLLRVPNTQKASRVMPTLAQEPSLAGISLSNITCSPASFLNPVPAIHILMAKYNLPFPRSWWGQRQVPLCLGGWGTEGPELSSGFHSWLRGHSVWYR